MRINSEDVYLERITEDTMDLTAHSAALASQGYTVIEDVFDEAAVAAIIDAIGQADSSHPAFRKTQDLFAIRQFLRVVPGVQVQVFTPALLHIIHALFGPDYFPVKSIYFDKPGQSNWFVAWHQDLTISVDKRIQLEGFGPWTVKHNQYAVQPPLDILEHNYTIRIHLDDTNEKNGALKVIPGSHLRGVQRPELLDLQATPEVSCPVKKGGIMIMRPLLLHASSRSTGGSNRRVVHIEFTDRRLPEGLQWSEL